MMRLRSLWRFVAITMCATLLAQAQEPSKPVLSAHARLMAARSIYMEHAGGKLPNEIIGDAFQGWGRFEVVYDPAKADLIVSVNAPVVDSGVSVSNGARDSSASRIVSSSNIAQIRLVILAAHDRVVLWSGTEQPKSALKERQREDNLIEASLRLFRRFRSVIEPDAP